jgi:hypothetical protein
MAAGLVVLRLGRAAVVAGHPRVLYLELEKTERKVRVLVLAVVALVFKMRVCKAQ